MRSRAYSLGTVVQCPDRLIDVDLVAKIVGKRRTLCDGRCHGRFEKVHPRSESIGEVLEEYPNKLVENWLIQTNTQTNATCDYLGFIKSQRGYCPALYVRESSSPS